MTEFQSQLLIGLSSGFIGALLGVAGSFGIFFLSNWRSAKENLRDKLLELKPVTMIHTGASPNRCAQYETSFFAVWKLVFAYRQTLPYCCRRDIDKAWDEYKGGKSSFGGSMYVGPTSDTQVEKRVKALMKALGYEN